MIETPLAAAKQRAIQLENRRAAVAVYGDKNTEAYKQLQREAEEAWGAYQELKAAPAFHTQSPSDPRSEDDVPGGVGNEA